MLGLLLLGTKWARFPHYYGQGGFTIFRQPPRPPLDGEFYVLVDCPKIELTCKNRGIVRQFQRLGVVSFGNQELELKMVQAWGKKYYPREVIRLIEWPEWEPIVPPGSPLYGFKIFAFDHTGELRSPFKGRRQSISSWQRFECLCQGKRHEKIDLAATCGFHFFYMLAHADKYGIGEPSCTAVVQLKGALALHECGGRAEYQEIIGILQGERLFAGLERLERISAKYHLPIFSRDQALEFETLRPILDERKKWS